jgi:hypothetical protein
VSYNGDDPLTVWWCLYEWVREQEAEVVVSVLSTALDRLQSLSSINNDPRYLSMWLVYATQHTPDTIPCLSDMHQQGVGVELSSLYEEWAAALEREDRLDEADAVFMQGLRQQARPLLQLINCYDQFKKRVAERKKIVPGIGATAAAVASVPAAAGDGKRKGGSAEDEGRSSKQTKGAAAAPAPPAPSSSVDRSDRTTPYSRPTSSRTAADSLFCCSAHQGRPGLRPGAADAGRARGAVRAGASAALAR